MTYEITFNDVEVELEPGDTWTLHHDGERSVYFKRLVMEIPGEPDASDDELKLATWLMENGYGTERSVAADALRALEDLAHRLSLWNASAQSVRYFSVDDAHLRAIQDRINVGIVGRYSESVDRERLSMFFGARG